MKPWERRLVDLSKLLENCHRTYMEPDLFRMNTNQFLQTSRTVTFIIQKNKDTIPSFDHWYKQTVLDAWKSDEVMTWAKEARNVIEKEGDLELNSTLNLTLLFSYLVEQDVKISSGHHELLTAGVKKLVRYARKSLPGGIEDGAVVKIERRWVTASLPNWELLKALRYAYSRVFDCCQSLSAHIGEPLFKDVPNPSRYENLSDQAQRVQYFKLSNLATHSLHYAKLNSSPDFEPPEPLKAFISQRLGEGKSRSIDSTSEWMTSMAELTFRQYGNHVPMLFLFDKEWKVIDMLSAKFADQADKYIFWRQVADRAVSLKAFGASWTSESWVRSTSNSDRRAIRHMPIVGERLSNIVFDRTGESRHVAWIVERDHATAKPELQRIEDMSEIESMTAFYLVPLRLAMGLSANLPEAN